MNAAEVVVVVAAALFALVIGLVLRICWVIARKRKEGR